MQKKCDRIMYLYHYYMLYFFLFRKTNNLSCLNTFVNMSSGKDKKSFLKNLRVWFFNLYTIYNDLESRGIQRIIAYNFLREIRFSYNEKRDIKELVINLFEVFTRDDVILKGNEPIKMYLKLYPKYKFFGETTIIQDNHILSHTICYEDLKRFWLDDSFLKAMHSELLPNTHEWCLQKMTKLEVAELIKMKTVDGIPLKSNISGPNGIIWLTDHREFKNRINDKENNIALEALYSLGICNERILFSGQYFTFIVKPDGTLGSFQQPTVFTSLCCPPFKRISSKYGWGRTIHLLNFEECLPETISDSIVTNKIYDIVFMENGELKDNSTMLNIKRNYIMKYKNWSIRI